MHGVIGGRRRSSGEPWLRHKYQDQRPSIDLPSLCSGHFQDTSTPERRKSRRNNNNNNSSQDMILSWNRQEFIPDEMSGAGISYSRKGGVFISKCGVATVLFVFLTLLAAVGLLVFFFAPCSDEEKYVVEDDLSWNIGDIYVRNADDTIRLLTTVMPSYYRIKIKPNFTTLSFDGRVTITLSTQKSHVKYITLHSRGLEILNGTTLIEQSTLPHNFTKTKRSATASNEENLYARFANSQNEDRKNQKINQASFGLPRQVLEHDESKFNTTHLGRTRERSGNRTSSDLNMKSKKKIKIVSMEKNPSIDRLIIALESYLKPNVNYTLDMSFKGKIDGSLTGFYYSTYKDLTDQKIEIIGATQFEPTSTRKCFPCFDEPNFKASFELSIASKPNQTVLSNMPLYEKEEIPGEDLVWSHFEKSEPMSPYLVAFTISEFVSADGEVTVDDENSDDNVDVPFQIWCRKELMELNQTAYASKIGPKLLSFYEKYFGVPYALPKLDLVAVPDFAAGAMENWGLITFKETNILIHPESDSIQAKKAVASTMAHEIAHQWFGNLVTMQWWTDLWLNEGFATYMEYIGIDAVEPSFKMLDEFTLDRMIVMVSDSMESTRPVSALVYDETQIGQIFDEISYVKSASLLRMLNSVMTKELFNAGLVNYMKEWQFKNSVQDDLWRALNDVLNGTSVFPNNLQIADFMDSWTIQSGYPVLNIERNYNNESVTISQKRFLLSEQTTNPHKELWYIPITYTLGGSNHTTWNTYPLVWLEKKESTQILVPSDSNTNWIYFNLKGIGHYRVNYDLQNWRLLQHALYENLYNFPIETRAQLMDDAFNLARAGQLNYTIPLDLTKYLIKKELDMVPWYAVLDNLEYLDLYLQKSQVYNLFQEYVSQLVTPTLDMLGYITSPEDNPQNAALRNQLIYWACKIEDGKCLDWALQHFRNWQNQTNPDKTNPIPFGVRQIVYSTVVKLGSRTEFDFLFERLKKTNDPEAWTQIIESLPSSRNSWHIYFLFQYAITTLDLSLQQNFWSGVKTELASDMALQYVINNWPQVFARLKNADDQLMQHVITAAFSRISDEQELRQFKRFIRANKDDLKDVSQLVQKYVEEAVLQIHWGKTKIQDIERWLKTFLNVNSAFSEISSFESNKEIDDKSHHLSSFVDDENDVLSHSPQSPYYMG